MTAGRRTEGDQWDIRTGVGYTALVVAAWRALHTAAVEPLARDEYARHFVGAAADPYLTGLLAAAPAGDAAVFPHLYGVQTRFFDEFFATAAADGIRQMVIVAAGLDTRAFRLRWPAGTTVFELDQPAVLAFKADVLAGLGARPAADRVAVGADLRGDWAAALTAAGFDPARPTAWSLEGLLPYLTGPAQDGLLAGISALSCDGTRIAIGALGAHFDAEEFAAVVADHPGVRIFRDVDFGALTYRPEQRADPADWLAGHGWTVTRVGGTVDLQADHGETPPEVVVAVDGVLRSGYLTAVRAADADRLVIGSPNGY